MPDMHVWEEDDVKLRVQAQGKKYKSAGKIEFVFTSDDDGKEVGRAPVKLDTKWFSANEAVGTFKPKKTSEVKDAQALFYKCKYHLEVDGKSEKDFTDKLYVYTKKITVTAYDSKDTGKKLKGAMCRLSQNAAGAVATDGGTSDGYSTVRETPVDGMITFNLKYPSADLKVEWVRPYLGKWRPDKDKGTAREADVTFAPKVKLVFPKKVEGQAVHKQYVNLDPDDAHPEYGRKIKVKAELTFEGVAEGEEIVARPVKVFFKAKFDANNGDRTGASKKKNETLEETKDVQIKGAKTEVTFDLDLGPAGGDKVVIEVGTAKDVVDDTVTVETWRKLYYELSAPKCLASTLPAATCADGNEGFDLPATTRTALTDILKTCFIEYVVRKAYDFDDDDLPDYQKIPCAYLGKTAPATLVVLTDRDCVNTTTDYGGFSGEEAKRSVLKKLGHMSYTTSGVAVKDVDATVDFVELTLTPAGYLFEKLATDGTKAVIKATYEADITGVTAPHPALTSTGAAKKGDLLLTYVTASKLTLKVPDADKAWVGAKSATKCPIKVSISYKAVVGTTNGMAAGPRQVINLVDGGEKCCASTIAHELGHSMGMTIVPGGNKPPPGMTEPKHVDNGGDYYRNPVDGEPRPMLPGVRDCHQGPHCAEGIGDKTAASFSGMAGTCIMFGESGAKDPPSQTKYCDVCVKYIKARKLEDILSRWTTRADVDC